MARLIQILIICLVLLTPYSALAVPELTVQGSIDFHIHSAPDSTPRSLNDYEVAQMAARAGMEAIVLKNHRVPTGDRAALVQQLIPGVEVYGGIVLNQAVGGINPSAVEAMVEVSPATGKIVWFPTIDSSYHHLIFQLDSSGLTVIEGEDLSPATLQVLQLIKQYDLVLATGHLSPLEIELLVEQAHRMGISKILITHPLSTVPGLTLTQLKKLIELGAYLELVYVNELMGSDSKVLSHRQWRRVSLREMKEVITTLGPEHFILATDLGRLGDPLPVQGYQKFISGLEYLGLEAKAIEQMTKINPHLLLH